MSAPPVLIERLAVIGTGLIGGSLARALRAAGVVTTIVGYDADPCNRDQALALGVVDEIAEDLAEAIQGAQLVFISVPVCAIPGVVR
jgi:prephenate dehydrogenase